MWWRAAAIQAVRPGNPCPSAVAALARRQYLPNGGGAQRVDSASAGPGTRLAMNFGTTSP